jgi:hypothetical protein
MQNFLLKLKEIIHRGGFTYQLLRFAAAVFVAAGEFRQELWPFCERVRWSRFLRPS